MPPDRPGSSERRALGGDLLGECGRWRRNDRPGHRRPDTARRPCAEGGPGREANGRPDGRRPRRKEVAAAHLAEVDGRYHVRGWELAIGGVALGSAAVAFWVTVNADFLAHPGWLAFQKADAILGPVLVGLYWLQRRPASRFGLLLIGFGFVVTPYILHSSSTSKLFTAGVAWEAVIYVATLAIILTFPTGRLGCPNGYSSQRVRWLCRRSRSRSSRSRRRSPARRRSQAAWGRAPPTRRSFPPSPERHAAF